MRLLKRLLLAIVLLVAGIFVALLLYEWQARREAFADFRDRLQAWHARCDAYVDQPVVSDEAKACLAELQRLSAEKKARAF